MIWPRSSPCSDDVCSLALPACIRRPCLKLFSLSPFEWKYVPKFSSIRTGLRGLTTVRYYGRDCTRPKSDNAFAVERVRTDTKCCQFQQCEKKCFSNAETQTTHAERGRCTVQYILYTHCIYTYALHEDARKVASPHYDCRKSCFSIKSGVMK